MKIDPKPLMIAVLFATSSFAQEKIDEQTKSAFEEGMSLYNLQRTCVLGDQQLYRYGIDSLNDCKAIPYKEGNNYKLIRFSKGPIPKVRQTITFDHNFSLTTCVEEFEERDFTEKERHLYTLYSKADEWFWSDQTALRTIMCAPRVIPLPIEDGYRVYILPQSKRIDRVRIGTDYVMQFDKKDNMVSGRCLHRFINEYEIPSFLTPGSKALLGKHTHMNELDQMLVPTDISQAFIWSSIAGWSDFMISSNSLIYFLDCEKYQIEVWDKNKFITKFKNGVFRGKYGFPDEIVKRYLL